MSTAGKVLMICLAVLACLFFAGLLYSVEHNDPAGTFVFCFFIAFCGVAMYGIVTTERRSRT